MDAYLNRLRLTATPRHVRNVRDHLLRIMSDCRLRTLSDLTADALIEWLAAQRSAGMGARTRNTYRAAACAFARWCARTGRLVNYPLEHVPRANERADERRKRRALTEQEIDRLLRVAEIRPVAECGRLTERIDPPPEQRKRSNWRRQLLSPANIDACYARGRETLRDRPRDLADREWEGRERRMIYRTLLLTGLRKGELASLTVAHAELDADPPHLVLDAADEKNRQGAKIALQRDLAADLRAFLADRARRTAEGQRGGVRSRLDPTKPLFHVPQDLHKILNRDLEAAGIAKRDDRGRVVDVHAFRHTFGTQLCRAGVPLRTAQAAMRHSSPELTAQTYVDPVLLDVAGAIDALPRLGAGVGAEEQRSTA